MPDGPTPLVKGRVRAWFEEGDGMPLDDDAVTAIYRDYSPMVRRMAFRGTHDAAAAEDVVQEVILKVWRAAPKNDNMAAYLAQTTRNVLVDRYRAASRRPKEVTSVDENLVDRPFDSDEVDRALDALLIDQALARLSADHVAIVRLLHVQRMSITDAAATLGVPEGTVKSRAFYALRQLRVILDEMGVRR
jgi:RNA polymerase sigma-70 factor, ECF subfamily